MYQDDEINLKASPTRQMKSWRKKTNEARERLYKQPLWIRQLHNQKRPKIKADTKGDGASK